MASDLLTTFKQHDMAWTRCHQILNEARHPYTKYYACQILEALVKSRWSILSAPEAEGIKQFVMQLAIELSSSFELLAANAELISKINLVLVEILKREWPVKWPNFIPEITGASKTSEPLCQNNMVCIYIAVLAPIIVRLFCSSPSHLNLSTRVRQSSGCFQKRCSTSSTR